MLRKNPSGVPIEKFVGYDEWVLLFDKMIFTVSAENFWAKELNFRRRVQIILFHKLFENLYLKSLRTNDIAGFLSIC